MDPVAQRQQQRMQQRQQRMQQRQQQRQGAAAIPGAVQQRLDLIRNGKGA
jgi:hypothetical protein